MMATVTKTVLGRVSGMVGNIVYRQFNGKTIASIRSGTYTLPMDNASVTRRAMFAFLMKYASAISSVPLLKSCWAYRQDKGNDTFNRIVSTNYKRTGAVSLLPETLLTPSSGVDVTVLEYSFTSTRIRLTLSAEFGPVSPRFKADAIVTAVVILSLSKKPNRNKPAFALIPLVSQEQPYKKGHTILVELPFTPQHKQDVKQYPSRQFLCALVLTSPKQQVLKFSRTVYVKIQ